MADFEVSGKQYVSTRLDPITAFGIACKLAGLIGIVSDVMPVIRKRILEEYERSRQREILRAQGLPLPDDEGIDPLKGIDPKLIESFGKAVSQVPDDHRNFIIAKCLSAVMRRQGAGMLPVWNAQRERINFDDIDVMDMCLIIYHVFQESLASFMKAAPAPSSAPEAAVR
jgi:hypothetical protein